VHSIANFLRIEDYRIEMIEFDPQQFFKVIQKLFLGKPWDFMCEWTNHQEDALKEPEDLITMLSTEALRLGVRKSANAPIGEFSAEGNVILDYFYLFVLQIQSGSFKAEEKETKSQKSVGLCRPLIMEKKILLDAIFRVLDAQMKHQKLKHGFQVEKKAIDSIVQTDSVSKEVQKQMTERIISKI